VLLAVAFAASLASACSPSVPQRGAVLWANSYAFGTLGEREFDARDVCGETPPRRLEVVATPATVLLSVVTLGLYVPRQVLIECP
jgi:hypothetical protein